MAGLLTGVVLCGGASSRMGTDKGLILAGEKHWASLVADKLTQISLPVFISINSSQQELYSKLFLPTQIIVDDAEVKGPLRGLLSVHEHFPDNDLLLMACDLIDVKESSLRNVIEQYSSNPGFDFYCYYHDGFFEPFCGIYTAVGLKQLALNIEKNNLHNYSFQHILNTSVTKKLSPPDMSDFKNYNTIG